MLPIGNVYISSQDAHQPKDMGITKHGHNKTLGTTQDYKPGFHRGFLLSGKAEYSVHICHPTAKIKIWRFRVYGVLSFLHSFFSSIFPSPLTFLPSFLNSRDNLLLPSNSLLEKIYRWTNGIPPPQKDFFCFSLFSVWLKSKYTKITKFPAHYLIDWSQFNHKKADDKSKEIH